MIPAFTAAGLLPPFVGDPADLRQRSPYATRLRDIILRFATSARRCEILQGWLAHRKALHSLGFIDGFQWVDGSFCEQLVGREPNDVDIVTFFVQPSGADLRALAATRPEVFDPRLSKGQYQCDAYFVTLHAGRFAEPRVVSYWYSLFSHRRHDLAWKGILQVPLTPMDDADANDALIQAASVLPALAAP
jgi:hypothetical protein